MPGGAGNRRIDPPHAVALLPDAEAMLAERRTLLGLALGNLDASSVALVATAIAGALSAGGKVLVAGNGGSAAVSTYAEYKKLGSQSRIVVLDDTTFRKTSRIRAEVLSQPDVFTVLFDEPHHRNGVMAAVNTTIPARGATENTHA